MYLVAVETSSRQGSIALMCDGDLCDEHHFAPGLVHGREVAPRIKALLEKHRLRPRDLGLLAVSVGPGSYTGVRVGVTAVKTLAFALDAAVVGISSLEVIARGALESLPHAFGGSLAVFVDGKQKMLYRAVFTADGGVLARRTGDVVADLRAGTISGDLEPGTLVAGDGADLFLDAVGDDARRFERAPTETDSPRARSLAALAADSTLRREVLSGPAVHGLVPIYLRASEAERRLAARAREAVERGAKNEG